MSKKIKTLVIIAAVVSVFVGGTVVLAASGNLGTTESAWLDFHKVMQKEMVLKGNLTQQEADEHLAKMQERFENSEDDEIYSRFSKREGKPEGRSGFGMKGRSGIIEDYAEISGKEPEEIIEELNRLRQGIDARFKL